jgi:putative hemolysin
MKIDVEEIIRKKNTIVWRLLPGFIINYLRRIIHETEINDILYRYQGVHGISFVNALIEKEFCIRFEVLGEEKIPMDGRLIIVSNHPLGGLDGLVLIDLISRYRKHIKFPVNDLLMNISNLRELFVPIDKTGKNSIQLARMFDELFQSDDTVLYFPAGICSRKMQREIQDLEWKKTFIGKAKSTQRDILPIYFDGKNSDFFYNLARLRKKLGIKINIEMLYLVDEMFKQKNATFKICIGNVIPYQTLLNTGDNNLLAQKIRKEVYDLKNRYSSNFEK